MKMDVMEMDMVDSTRSEGRRPRIVRQRGVAGLWESAYSGLYRLLLLVTPLR